MASMELNASNLNFSENFLEYASIGRCSSTSNSSETGRNFSDDSAYTSIDKTSFRSSLSDSNSSYSDDSLTAVTCKSRVIGSRKRKSSIPCRSSPANDPNFRGVTIKMENKFIDSEWKLIIHSTFSLPPKKKRKIRAYVDSSDEEDINNNYPPIHEEKHCASCSVKKTPLWRDAEDGTPLCNACGIRYKKYKLRCGTCWHIPKKDEFHPICQYCGSFYEYVSPRR